MTGRPGEPGRRTTRALLGAVGAGALLAVPLLVRPDDAPPVLLAALGLPLAAGLALLALHRPLWAVAAVPAAAAVGLRELGGGVQVVQVLAALALGCVALRLLVAPRPFPRSRPLLWAGALLLAALAATAVSDRVVPALRADAGLVLGVGLAVALVALVRRRHELVLVLRATAAGSLLVTLPVLGQLGALQGVHGGAAVAGRPVGVFVQPNELGSYAVTLLWLSLALAVLARRRADLLLGLGAAAAAAAAALFSLSRGSWSGAAAGAVALVVLHPRAGRTVAAAAVAAALVVATAVAVAPVGPVAVVVERASTLTTGAVNPEDRRDLVRAEAVRQLADAPVLGHGPASFAPEAAGWESAVAAYRRAHAHNVVLQVGAETGLVGVVALLGLGASTVAATWRRTRAMRRAGDDRAALATSLLAAGVVAFAVHGVVDVTFQNPLVMAVTWVLLGALLASVAGPPPARRPPAPDADGRAAGGDRGGLAPAVLA